MITFSTKKDRALSWHQEIDQAQSKINTEMSKKKNGLLIRLYLKFRLSWANFHDGISLSPEKMHGYNRNN